MPDLNHMIGVAASPDKVYAAIATEAGLRSWWTADTTFDAKVGGKAVFGFGGKATVFRMTVEALEPGRRVALSCQGEPAEWNGTMPTWTLAPDGGGTVLRFTHGNWKAPSDMCALCNSTWGELMNRLKNTVEGRNPGPRWLE